MYQPFTQTNQTRVRLFTAAGTFRNFPTSHGTLGFSALGSAPDSAPVVGPGAKPRGRQKFIKEWS